MAKILIVDDNQVSHQILRVLLERDNHEVASVFNGQEALDKLEKSQVDLVITDVNMPIMDGRLCGPKIRELEKAKGQAPATIVALTGEHDFSAKDYPAFDIVSIKPIDLQTIQSLLLQALPQ